MGCGKKSYLSDSSTAPSLLASSHSSARLLASSEYCIEKQRSKHGHAEVIIWPLLRIQLKHQKHFYSNSWYFHQMSANIQGLAQPWGLLQGLTAGSDTLCFTWTQGSLQEGIYHLQRLKVLQAASFWARRQTYLVTCRSDSIRDFVLKDKIGHVLHVKLTKPFSLMFEKD